MRSPLCGPDFGIFDFEVGGLHDGQVAELFRDAPLLVLRPVTPRES
jgi:hypothetical protein